MVVFGCPLQSKIPGPYPFYSPFLVTIQTFVLISPILAVVAVVDSEQ
jgi:hypothetical protein